MTAFTVHKIANTTPTQYFTEPLVDLGDAIPLDMVLVPAGRFTMGSPEDEPERGASEGPQHEVSLRSFFMGRYPVTQMQWQAVAALDKVKVDLEASPSEFQGPNLPVERVSWYEAVEFCERLKKHTQRPYRLPSEAEWEYACRAGSTTPFAFGKMPTTEVANYDGDESYNNGPTGKYRSQTTPVDEFGFANAFGLSDMHGNVDEWCADHWHDNYEGAPADGSAWQTPNESEYRVLRGGSWNDYPRYCRSATRDSDRPDGRSFNPGFRVCCIAPRTLPLPTS